MLEKIFKRCGSRGQALVFFALMIPMTFMFFGAAFEFGWWYLNQSRLQNAADAAVIAGAYKIIENDPEMMKYKVVDFINENDEEFQKFIVNDRVSRQSIHTEGFGEAKTYTDYNMPDSETEMLSSIEDALYRDKKVPFADAYYEVELKGTVDHLFNITNQFGDMNIRASAVAKLIQVADGRSLLKQVQELEKTKIIRDWERTKKERGESDNKYAMMRTVRSVNRSVDYTDGQIYRTETLILNGSGDTSDAMETTGDAHVRQNMHAVDTKTNQYKTDDMFIDFRPDLNYNSTRFQDDWDIGNGALADLTYKWQGGVENARSYESLFDLRILATINFDAPYPVRAREDSKGNEIKDSQGNSLLPSDPLYIRIESEPIYNDGTTTGHSSVRQIIININCDNTTKDDNGNYLYRPLVIFYDGPEKLGNDKTASTVRDSKPVIVNFNADFRGILVTQYSSMVINGNGHKFYGFVIAKDFLHVKTDEDFKDYAEVQIAGNKFFVHEDDLKTRSDVLSEAANTNKTVFADGSRLMTVPKSKLTNMKDASEFDTTTYVRPAYKPDGKTKRDDVGTDVYVRKSKLSRIEETPIPGGRDKWYDFVKRSDPNGTMYCLDNVDEDVLLYSGGWRVVTDSDDNQKIVKNFEQNVDATYIKIDKDGEEIYIDATSKYYTKYAMNDGQEHVNSVYIDNKGNVQYNDTPIEPTKENADYEDYRRFLKLQDQKIFDYKKDFSLSESHYDSFEGVVFRRGVYQYLDKNDSCDNFFTTERAEWIT